jgi:hypothetical protein
VLARVFSIAHNLAHVLKSIAHAIAHEIGKKLCEKYLFTHKKSAAFPRFTTSKGGPFNASRVVLEPS